MAAAVVQNWLSFGLLEEFFQVHVPEADFTTVSEGRKVLNSSRLHEYGGEWQEPCASLEEAGKLEAIARLKEPFYEC
ncbi:hypothetical protein N7486_005929 [Penicillium sp. IBT 16267x]|nr:hypothetical protein N7486_005929 [Penicillium sp. IBT 16267x]